MRLSKTVPKRQKHFDVLWLREEFTTYSEQWHSIRPDHNKCYWCKKQFQDGDYLAIAHEKDRGNKMVCTTCAKKLRESDND